MSSAVLLPTARGIKVDRPRMITWDGELVPPLGGEVQHLQRLGTRHAVDMTIPLMRSEPDGRIWSTKLRLAKLYGARAWYRQDNFPVGTPGSPVVDGSNQTGSVLAMRGFVPGYQVRFGQAFSHLSNDRYFLYFSAADVTANGAGKLTLPIFPMLRRIANDGETLEWTTPIIEGSLSGNEVAWTRMTAPYCDFGTISIAEDA